MRVGKELFEQPTVAIGNVIKVYILVDAQHVGVLQDSVRALKTGCLLSTAIRHLAGRYNSRRLEACIFRTWCATSAAGERIESIEAH